MSFTGKLERHEQVVLIHPGAGFVIDARVPQDVEYRLGESAIAEFDVVHGLPVSSVTINLNIWNVFRSGDPNLTNELLSRYYSKVRQVEEME